MFLLSVVSAATPGWVLAGILVLTGTGLGFFVQVSLLAGQNGVDTRDLGVATGALNFFKTIGGRLRGGNLRRDPHRTTDRRPHQRRDRLRLQHRLLLVRARHGRGPRARPTPRGEAAVRRDARGRRRRG